MRHALALAAALFAFAPAAPAQEDPESVYAKFHRALQAGDMATMIRHGSEPGATEMRNTPPGEVKGMLELMKKLIPATYTLVGKDISPDGSRATLRATGTGPSLFSGKQETQYGRITMVKQGGEWKVQESNWDGKPHAAAGAKPAAPAPAASAAPASPAPRPAAAKPAPARPVESARPKSAPPVVGTLDSAPERKLGAQKPPCVYKPVMTAEDMEACR